MTNKGWTILAIIISIVIVIAIAISLTVCKDFWNSYVMNSVNW